MKYSSYIDNVASKEWGLTIQQAYLFDWIYSLPSWASSITTIDGIFHFASKSKACEELPILTDKVDTMYRYYKSLADLGLIILIKLDGRDYVRLTDKAKLWGRSSINSENNPSQLGKSSENGSDKNPTYKNTIYDKITSDTTESKDSAKKKEKIKGEKKEREKTALGECIAVYKKIYPARLFTQTDAAKLKSIINKISAYGSAKGTIITLENTVQFFEHFIKHPFLPQYLKGAQLSTLDSHFDTAIEKIENGKIQPSGNKPSARDIANAL